MRNLASLMLMALMSLALAAPAVAAPSFSLVWSGTTGSGTVGGSVIDALPGDTLTLDVLLHIDADGLYAWDFALFGTGVTAVGGEECPAGSSSGSGTNPGSGICLTSDSFAVFSSVDPGVAIQGGDILGFQGVRLSTEPNAQSLPMLVGRGVFTVTGVPSIFLGPDASNLGDFTVIDASLTELLVTATAVPEPGTLGLLALGLVGLARATRRGVR